MKINSVILLLSGIILLNTSCNGQSAVKENSASGDIHWMGFEQAVAKNQTGPKKKIFIDISTAWCGWCKRMDATTFKDSAVVRYMNENYYAVKLDAETHDTLHFQGKTFVFRPEYKSNELALSLLSGQMSYPSFIFMDENFALLSPLAGYQTVEQIMPPLKFFGGDIYKTMKWDEYQKTIGN